VPPPHALHERLVVLEPAELTNSPAVQVVNAVQLAALTLVLYVPLAQVVHVRLVVLFGRVLAYSPAEQSLHAAQLTALVAVL
jgi:hypothetical protein